MVQRLIKRMAVGICFALVAGAIAVAVGEAGGAHQEGPVRTDCSSCHESVVHNWEESAHGRATTDPIFAKAWEEQGKQAQCLECHTTNYDSESGTWDTDGISCSVCHSGQTGPHPETPMPTDPSSRLCGTCHIDTHSEWSESAHAEGELTCVRCHNPHTTSLKVGNMTDLCMACHNNESHFYGYTAHAQNGLTCTDCHLRVSDSPMGEGHGKREHTFVVDLETCSTCHGQEMHFPVAADEAGTNEMMWSAYSPVDDTVLQDVGRTIQEEPEQAPAQPLNYLLVAAVGLGFGVAVTPWAEDWYKRVIKRS